MGRHGTREQWVERVARFERSGEDAATFALREGVTKRLLLWWRWRLERDAEASTAAAPSSTPSGMSTSTALSFVRVDVPVIGIVENMSFFLCPHCGERSEIFGHGGARDEAERLGVPFLGEIPLHLSIRVAGDAGTPIVAADTDSANALAFAAVADRVWQDVARRIGDGRRQPPSIVFE